MVFLSIFAMRPDSDVDHDAGYTASELSIRETVDGSVTSTSYVNPDGVITEAIDMGYATVCRMRDDNDRVVEERYLDASGDPVTRNGHYCGVSYEYNETSTVITYLDAEGNPAPTNAGYTILKRTYHRDGTADTDMYFDANGNQKALSKGQYGIKRSGKVNLLLDRNGSVMPCVDNLLNGFPCMAVVFGCVVCLLMIVLPKSLSVVLTIVYVAFIPHEILMFRESGDARTNFVLFPYAGKFLKGQSVRAGHQ